MPEVNRPQVVPAVVLLHQLHPAVHKEGTGRYPEKHIPQVKPRANDETRASSCQRGQERRYPAPRGTSVTSKQAGEGVA